ncbi:MarR family winged helix-turn-helix transcriptional regulator [Streptomyces sp. XD-27]|uniref:MarR family winged helix-turn-helix transcriptional regulator n=1 Tax=Streptomyces sp. XD-27 TaxID=3062779 RepID=UPI0026F44596|nr:MarR family transcriptional regulator [Streptomyces sp. XD-27]WKX69571.1 MarR family transcriptional regulator [Streptomyces sp. XD-27]
MSDAVDAIVGQWEKERPDLTPHLWPVHALARIQRLARVVEKSCRTTATQHGLDYGEFDVLTTLKRSGPPYQLTAGAFLKAAMVTSGAITNRIDKMEAKGLVERVREGSDRRIVYIRLTEHGAAVIDSAMVDHLRNYERLLADVDRETITRAADALREISEALGDTSIT